MRYNGLHCVCERAVISIVILVAFAFPLVGPGNAQDIKFERDRARVILGVVAKTVEKEFYDEKMKGLNWAALVQQARGRVDAARDIGQMYMAIFALTEQLDDSHTVFLPPRRAEKIRFGFEAKAVGEQIFVTELKASGAAARAGLRRGDQILGVNGLKAERESFNSLMLFLRVLNPATALEIVYSHGGGTPQRAVVQADITRRSVILDMTDIANVYQLIREAESAEEPDLTAEFPGKIGYLKLMDFVNSPEYTRRLVGKLKDADAVILDLRENPGGTVKNLSQFVGHFESEAGMMAELRGRKKVEGVEIKPQNPNVSKPMFILIDSQSASAAEMFARHFQRKKKAVVIGDRSSGRVTFAHFYVEQAGADVIALFGVQVAVARVFFPDGSELEKNGVTPDEICLPTPSDLAEGRDVCVSRAISLARKSLGLPEMNISVPTLERKKGG